MNPNSVATFREHIGPNLSDCQKEVFEIIKAHHPHGITGYEVAMILDKFPNQISGRFGELVALDLIILDGYRKLVDSKNPKTNHGIWILKEKIKVDKDGQATLF